MLRHSRIYLLPTRRGWAVIGTLLLMLLASLNYALALGVAVTFLLAGLVAAAQLHTFRNLAGIEITPLAARRDLRRRQHRLHARAARRRRARHDIVIARRAPRRRAATSPRARR